MALHNDSETQLILEQAERILWDLVEARPFDDNARLWLAYSTIQSVRVHSKSSNGIPGLRGLGLTEAIALAESIISDPPSAERDISIQSYRQVASSITLGTKSKG